MRVDTVCMIVILFGNLPVFTDLPGTFRMRTSPFDELNSAAEVYDFALVLDFGE